VTCGGDSGNRIFFLYWRFPLIRVSLIRGSTVSLYYLDIKLHSFPVNLYVLNLTSHPTLYNLCSRITVVK
jgi:hypothetical protein